MHKKVILHKEKSGLYSPKNIEQITRIYQRISNPGRYILRVIRNAPSILQNDNTGDIFSLLGLHAINDEDTRIRLKALEILLNDNDGITIIEDLVTHESQSLPNNLLADLWLIEDVVVNAIAAQRNKLLKQMILLNDEIIQSSPILTDDLLTEIYSSINRIKLLNTIQAQRPSAVDRVRDQLRNVQKALNSRDYTKKLDETTRLQALVRDRIQNSEEIQQTSIIIHEINMLTSLVNKPIYADDKSLKAAYKYLLSMSPTGKDLLVKMLLNTEGFAIHFPSPTSRLLMTLGVDEKTALAYYLFFEAIEDETALYKLANIIVNTRTDQAFLDYLLKIFNSKRTINYKGQVKENCRPTYPLQAVCYHVLERSGQAPANESSEFWRQEYENFLYIYRIKKKPV
ncbi:MAG: hypothetical protein ABIH39_01860 [Candidatus Margulisiibacteriota bacterium]